MPTTTPTMTSRTRSSPSEVSPRWSTRRRPERSTIGPKLAATAKLLGTPFMPWQRLVADVGGEIDPATGTFAYREVIVTVMRQSGKTTLVLPWEVQRCLGWDLPQRVIYTAQTGQDAREKLLEDQVPMIEASALGGLITPERGGRIVRRPGAEAIVWPNRSRIALTASTEAAGHGRSVNLGVIDEAWKDEDDRREQALVPAMATVADAQLLVVSTLGNEKSVYLKRKVEAGRDAATRDLGSGIAYFEFSIPDDADIDDPAVWRRYMPALCPTPGPCSCSPDWRHTITEAAVAHARSSMKEPEFRRAFCNQWADGEDDRVIPSEIWDPVLDPSADAMSQPDLKFGFDVLPDRSSGSIGAAAGGHLELVEWNPGVTWLEDRLVQLYERWGKPIAVDGGGPAIGIADDLERRGVPVQRIKGADVPAACGRLYDAIADAAVRVRPDGRLDDSVAGIAKKTVGDRFVWSRTASSSDATPTYAVTLAYSAEDHERGPVIW